MERGTAHAYLGSLWHTLVQMAKLNAREVKLGRESFTEVWSHWLSVKSTGVLERYCRLIFFRNNLSTSFHQSDSMSSFNSALKTHFFIPLNPTRFSSTLCWLQSVCVCVCVHVWVRAYSWIGPYKAYVYYNVWWSLCGMWLVYCSRYRWLQCVYERWIFHLFALILDLALGAYFRYTLLHYITK